MAISGISSGNSEHEPSLVGFFFFFGVNKPTRFWTSALTSTAHRGRIYGQFNPKWVYVLCVVIFEVGSAICGAAPNMDALIIGRALGGLGGGGMYLGVMMMLSLFTTPVERPKYIGIIGVVFGFGTV